MSNRAPLTKRISALAITAAAALSFALFSPNAQANHVPGIKPTKEYIALSAALPAGVTPESATGPQLGAAVQAAIAANPTLKPGNIAGEALKHAGSAAQGDGGAQIATNLQNANPGGLPEDTLAARDAIKRAGKGKDLNVSLVPDFSAQFFLTNQGAIDLAKLVIATKPGAGAVIGGRASQLTTQTAMTDLANQALTKTAGISSAAQDITKYVAIEVDLVPGGDTATFTTAVAAANVPLASKIGTGGVAGDPTNGGLIVDSLLRSDALPKLRSGIAGFVKTVGAVADIEEISRIATAVGNQIATAAGTTTRIKFAAANGVVKSLAKSIVAKATTTNTAADRNSWDNKQDEIGETAAYMVGRILNTNTIQGAGGGKPQITAKNAGAKILAIVKSAINATKPKKVQTAAAAAGDTTFFVDTAVDVAGSVAETLASLRDALPTSSVLFDAIKATLIAKANTIAGKTNGPAIQAAINEAYEQTPPNVVDTRFEDGTQPPAVPPLISGLPTPDLTDTRPF